MCDQEEDSNYSQLSKIPVGWADPVEEVVQAYAATLNNRLYAADGKLDGFCIDYHLTGSTVMNT